MLAVSLERTHWPTSALRNLLEVPQRSLYRDTFASGPRHRWGSLVGRVRRGDVRVEDVMWVGEGRAADMSFSSSRSLHPESLHQFQDVTSLCS